MTFLKQYISIIKNNIFLFVGVALVTYNIFNFSYKGGHGGSENGLLPKLPSISGYEFEYVAYYYATDTLLYISIGAVSIVLGVLVIRDKKGV